MSLTYKEGIISLSKEDLNIIGRNPNSFEVFLFEVDKKDMRVRKIHRLDIYDPAISRFNPAIEKYGSAVFVYNPSDDSFFVSPAYNAKNPIKVGGKIIQGSSKLGHNEIIEIGSTTFYYTSPVVDRLSKEMLNKLYQAKSRDERIKIIREFDEKYQKILEQQKSY